MENLIPPLGYRSRYPARHKTRKRTLAQILTSPLVLTTAGLATYAFTYYSIEGLSAFGLGGLGALAWEGRPEFAGREFVPGIGGALGTVFTVHGLMKAFQIRKEQKGKATWIAIVIGGLSLCFVTLKMLALVFT